MNQDTRGQFHQQNYAQLLHAWEDPKSARKTDDLTVFLDPRLFIERIFINVKFIESLCIRLLSKPRKA